MVKRNAVQELLKARQAHIQQASFIESSNNSDSPVEVASPMGPWDEDNISIAFDMTVSDADFYAAVDKDIKEYGYFKGDRQYGEGSNVSNEKLFDEMFGPDKVNGETVTDHTKDVMPTRIGPGQDRVVKSLWDLPDDIVDPRDEFKKDTTYWVQLLRLLYTMDGQDPEGLFGLMYGLRCEGSCGLEPNPKGGVKVFARDERVWSKARAEIMGNKTWMLNLNAMLGQVVP